MAVWKTMRHNGVAFPDPYVPKGLTVIIKGQTVNLSPLAEEMAYNFAKKKDTTYVQDPVFVGNFMKYFAAELPAALRSIDFKDINFSEFYELVDAEKRTKESMSKEEKKALAASRKERRLKMKEKYGKAMVDGKEVEIANWVVEPPGLYMGRGCVTADTIVMTTLGPKYVEEVKKDDLVATHRGSKHMFYKKVASVAKQGVRPVYRLRTRTHSILATKNHPFLALRGQYTKERNRPRLRWVQLKQLRRGDYVVVARRYATQGTRKFSSAQKRTFENTIITPKFARMLGYYLGDGYTKSRSANTISFSEGHPRLLQRYAKICEDVFGITPISHPHSGGSSYVLTIYSREFADLLESMGFSGGALTKRVPFWVFTLADDLKCSFIRGYLDADGNYFSDGINGVEDGSFGFESPNRRFVEDFRELAISAGLETSNLTLRYGRGSNNDSTKYRFFISEHGSVNRLLDPGESMKGNRTRSYVLGGNTGEWRKKWGWSRLQIPDSELYSLERVIEIVGNGQAMTYDISVADPGDPNFIANQFVVHNSHPFRGSWKPRIRQEDVVLNLDRAAPIPAGNWKQIVSDSDSIWIAKWIDKLTGREKYVWPHESSEIQQSRSKEKYDKALRIGGQLERLRRNILRTMASRDEKNRKIATVSHLIDRLGMRVGDEKDDDEADTVGATTLRVEHVKIGDDRIEFDFFGKDYVRWVKVIENPEPILVQNLRRFTAEKKPDDEIFDVVTSGMVNRFLSGIVPGLTAKVFRTYHATLATERMLRSRDLREADDVEKRFFAKEANLAAAEFCNHRRTPPKTWEESLKKKEAKLAGYRAKGKENMIRKMEKEIDFAKKTKEYNLNTSLKNYIDPRVYKSWCDFVGMDWERLYTSSLQRKFSWVAKSRKPWAPRGEQEIVVQQKATQKSAT